MARIGKKSFLPKKKSPSYKKVKICENNPELVLSSGKM